MKLVHQNTTIIARNTAATIKESAPIATKQISSIPLFDKTEAAKTTAQRIAESNSNGASIITTIQISQSEKSCCLLRCHRCYRRHLLLRYHHHQTIAIYPIDGILMKMRSTINRISIKDEATARTAKSPAAPSSLLLSKAQAKVETVIRQQQTCCRRRRHETTNKQSSIILMKIHLVLLIIALLTATSMSITRATVAASAATADSTQTTTAKTASHTMKYSSNVVRTKYGELRGIVVRNNPTVEAYLGVPYATPPVGSLRYMPPVTPSAWKSTRLADRFSPVCPQLPPVSPTGREALLEVPRERLAQIRRLLPLLSNQSEDCLYLNLYVPRTVESSGKNNKALAAIMYIHGESFEWNSGNPYDGSILAAHGNVIVITINFRLGVLGFLKTGSKGSAQGNFGLMDLVAAIHWLRENLPAFNGDPNKLTLMGHGTGASLANMLIASPTVSDLIQRAILFSGSALSPWAIQKDPLYVKRKVAEHTGCHGDLVEDDLAPCLRTKPLSNLLSVQLETPRFLPGFAPFVDGSVIVSVNANANSSMTLPMGSAISSTVGIEMADFSKSEIIFGVATLESYLDLSAQDLEFGFNETRRDRILRTYVRNNFNYHLNEIYAALKNEYTDWERPPRNPLGSRDAALELLSDGHTVAPLVRVGYLHSLRGGKSYFMHFNHMSNERDFPQRSGTVRGESVPFTLGLPISPLFPHNYTIQDIKISRSLVRYLTNFAHTGNPNESPSSMMYISQSKHNHIATPMDGIHHLSPKMTTITTTNANAGDVASSVAAATDVNAGVQSVNVKQKRQMTSWPLPFRRRKKQSRNFNYYDNEDDSDEDDDSSESDEDTHHYTHNRDRLEDTNDQPYPFWDTYDTLNQYYLEVGNRLDMKNHYRGHKLSLWLNLIPQLHMPGDLNELSIRHHHFSESDAKFYDGVVRVQSIEKPVYIKTPTIIKSDTTTTTKTSLNPIVKLAATTPATATDCPSNTTVLPTLAATKPQHNAGSGGAAAAGSKAASAADTKLDNKSFHLDGFLRHLTNSQFHSYSAALAITIGVGCFLLLLNILIFAGIYYQRVKRTLDAKKKEEFVESSDIMLPNFIDHCMEKNGGGAGVGMSVSLNGEKSALNIAPYTSNMDYDEYNRYVEKAMMAKASHHSGGGGVGGCVNAPIENHKCKSFGKAEPHVEFLSIRTPEKSAHNISMNNSVVHPKHHFNPTAASTAVTYSSLLQRSSLSEPESSNSSEMVTYQYQQSGSSKEAPSIPMQIPPPQTEQCNQSTQSDFHGMHDVGTTVMESDVDDRRQTTSTGGGGSSEKILSTPSSLRSSISTSNYQGSGGILRQQQFGPTTPSTSKKRVQIQEISV